MPTLLEILHLTWSMCSAQLSLLSIVMPRNVVEDTGLIALSSISSFVGLICFLLDVLNIMHWVLSMFKDNLLVFSQTTSFLVQDSFCWVSSRSMGVIKKYGCHQDVWVSSRSMCVIKKHA